MWGRAMGGARLLPLLLLLLPGAVGLECLSCGAEDGTCRGAVNVTCPPESDVCAEALAAVTWSHGRWALGGRGCGRGRGGAVGRALELFGVVVFARRRQCRGRGCNGLLPLGQEGALPLAGNASERVPNGLRCYGCHDDGRCSPPTVVQCYGDLRGCFHGNVSLTLGGVTAWREVRGCVRDTECRREARGDAAVGLRGSCCAGDLCNDPSPNKTFFAPHLPRLELLPHPPGPAPAPNATDMAAGTADDRPTPADGSRGQRQPDKMAAGATQRATGATKMAAGTSGVNGVNGGVNGANVDSANANMATVGPKMADVGPTMADVGANMADIGPNMANANMATVGPKVATVGPKVATVGPKVADIDPKMADVGPNMANTNMADVGPKMAAGEKAAAGRAGSGRGGGGGGAKGRGHPMGGPGWLLPLLLLPLL